MPVDFSGFMDILLVVYWNFVRRNHSSRSV